MRLTIANISTALSSPDVAKVVAAIGRQVAEHFKPEWAITATLTAHKLTIAGKHTAPIDGDHDAIIYLGDASQDPTTGVNGALGYHFTNHTHIPYGFVYLDICKQHGEAWNVALSHEVLELLADPNAETTVIGPGPKGASAHVHYDLEVCDPTQGDTYEIDGVAVANFVGKAYFHERGGSGKTNHLGLPLEPLGVRPGGYFQYEDGAQAHQVTGPHVTKAMLDAKALMGKARRNARRAERLVHQAAPRVLSTSA
jgi:hypothetical protein